MKITWLGHSAFELFSHGVKILIDPFFTGNPFAGDTVSLRCLSLTELPYRPTSSPR